jgi:hypothetical protein
MGLTVIRNQPVSMQDIAERNFMCDRDSGYCTTYNLTEDTIRVQLKQEPCDATILCNGDFDSGANLVTNGDFATNLSGWTNSGPWAWSAAGATVSTAAAETLAQAIAGLTNGNSYTVTFEVTEYTSGNVRAVLGGGTAGTARNAVGVYTETIVAGAGTDLTFQTFTGATNGFIGTIDNVSVISPSTCWTNDASWVIGTGSACHTPGTAGDLTQTISSPLVTGGYYLTTLNVFSMENGTLTVTLGGTLIQTITENGTYNIYATITLTDNDLLISADSDFDGCVNTVAVYKMLSATEITAEIYTAGGSLAAEMDITLVDEFVTLTYAALFLSEGCYQIVVFDPCSSFSLSEISGDVPFNNHLLWTYHDYVAGDGSIAVGGGALTQTTTLPGGISGTETNAALQAYSWNPSLAGAYFTVTLQTGAYDSSLNASANLNTIELMLPNGAGIANSPTLVVDPQPNTTYTVSFFAAFNNAADSDIGLAGSTTSLYNKWAIAMSQATTGMAAGEVNELLSFSLQVYQVALTGFSLVSNCIKIATDTTGTKLIEGDSDESRSLGFYFDVNFWLTCRHGISFVNPHLSTKNDNYLYSTGAKHKTNAQVNKLWDLVIHEGDQNIHDAIATMLMCDTFTIGDSTATAIEYHCEDKSYNPDWGKKGDSPLAEAVVEVSRKTDTRFNINY